MLGTRVASDEVNSVPSGEIWAAAEDALYRVQVMGDDECAVVIL
jgi:hypothetical protein